MLFISPSSCHQCDLHLAAFHPASSAFTVELHQARTRSSYRPKSPSEGQPEVCSQQCRDLSERNSALFHDLRVADSTSCILKNTMHKRWPCCVSRRCLQPQSYSQSTRGEKSDWQKSAVLKCVADCDDYRETPADVFTDGHEVRLHLKDWPLNSNPPHWRLHRHTHTHT